MSGYVPTVGDKVKATLGENVLVGEVIDEYAGDLIEIVVSEDESLTLERDAWQFEQIVTVPTKFGAVIRRADGLISFLADTFEEEGSRWWHPTLGWCTEAHATAGGFTVLFEGVDE